jgi:TPR repeat protein
MRALTNIRCICVVAALIPLATAAQAADDTARFYGTWVATVLHNRQMIKIVSVHDANGYANYVRLPNGDSPTGQGSFSAANGIWTSNAAPPNNGGVYHFLNKDTVIATNSAGQAVTWIRDKAAATGPTPLEANEASRRTTGYIPPANRPGNDVTPPAGAQRASVPPPSQAGSESDASLSPAIKAGFEALKRKDSRTAWNDFMAEARKGDSDGEGAVGAMLFQRINPPGTGFYADCEKWLLASARQDNQHGMDMLAQYYFNEGRNIAGGINPGVNNAPIPPQLQQQADGKFALARQWFEKAAAKGDLYAMGNLAIMLDSGLGGPRDHDRAAELREQVKKGPDANFAKRVTADPNNLATTAAWQAGHYADAIREAQARAAKGDANAEALLGRAYYEGVGVPRNFATARTWLEKAYAQGNTDAMFFLGLVYEHGYGVPQNIPKSMELFDRAAGLGQRYAEMEAKGMRMQGEADAQAARSRSNGVLEVACGVAGGVSVGPECIRSGETIDPFKP